MQSESGSKLPLGLLRSLLNPSHDTSDSVEYLYAYTEEGDRRWSNLTSYLKFMQHLQPEVLLVGEAPGYRGTAVSGLPFLSEGMIKDRRANGLVLPITDYAPSVRYQSESGYEATSKVMWSVLDEACIMGLPLLWAVFPNHPHVSGEVMTNRKPSRREVAAYSEVIPLLMDAYAVKQIAAVGNVAYDTLSLNTDYKIVKLRHPARGGANKFRDGFNTFMEATYGRRD